jgi:hypothetical protein
MATLPYVTAPGNVTRALNAIISASTPDKVTQDFVKEMLGIPGGSGNQIASYLKKIGFVAADGTPTDIYKKFRNEDTRGAAAAAALRYGYAPLHKRNEYMHTLNATKLKGLIIEETGAGEDSSSVSNTAKCIENLKAFAKHDQPLAKEDEKQDPPKPPATVDRQPPPSPTGGSMSLNLGYTINLNLPPTTDIAVFNAIFKSLKDNLLRSGDE